MHIVIVGGGTAGWLTAAIMNRKQPDQKITVIESSKIGIIGVGESTTGYFTETLIHDLGRDFDVDHDEFIVETGATLKFGIKHKGWTKDINSHYFSVLEGSMSVANTPDYMFAYAMDKDHQETVRTTHTGFLLDQNKSNLGSTMQFSKYGHAMHIDANLTGKYLAKKCLKRPNVQMIDSEVVDIILNEQGEIKELKLSNDTTVSADFFIDCSGMSRLLINKLDDGWVSYKKNLPVDSAIPFMEVYQPGEQPVPYTTAWAQKSGWMWQTPLLDRRGNGYVFDSNFTTPEKAQEEIETLLGRPINVGRVLKFDAGRKPNAWVKNCVAIGLSNSFLEPLEATSIHTTIVQIRTFVNEFLRPTLDETMNQGSINLFNKRIAKHFDDIRDYICIHYMGGRDDSEFWKWIATGETQSEFVKDMLDTLKSRFPGINDFARYPGAIGWELYCYILAGIGKLDPKIILNSIDNNVQDQLEYHYKKLKNDLAMEYQDYQSYNTFVEHFRNIRKDLRISN
jgi:tryptophan halogenase